MPKRTDLKHILVIGSGPIVIGQACEFDYSGTQACRVLREEGLRVSLVNSNPATIMTDPEFADATYIEPITAEFVEKVIAQERPDAVLATLGGQTALNTAIALHEHGMLEKYDVELIGADFDAIQRGEDRQKFKDIVRRIGGESRARVSARRWTRSARPSPNWACPSWCGRRSRWAASAPAWRTRRGPGADRRRRSRRVPRPDVLIEESSSGGRSTSSS